MNYSKFARFRTVGKKPKVQKFPAQKSPKVSTSFDDLLNKSKTNKIRDAFGTNMDSKFYTKPPLISITQERISKVGRRVESGAFGRMSKIRTAAASRVKKQRDIFGKEKTKLFVRTNKGLKQTPFGKKVKAKVSALQTRAFKLAEKKGAKVEAKMSKKLNIIIPKPKDRSTSFYNKKSDSITFARGKAEDFRRNVEMGFEPKNFRNYSNEGNTLNWKFKARKSIYKEQNKRRKQFKK